MTIAFTNNFKNILDQLRKVLRDEFKGTLPVYIGHEQKEQGSQYLRLEPMTSELIEFTVSAEMRQYQIDMYYYFADPNVNKTSLDHVLRYVSRLEALIHDNIAMVLSDGSNCFNCRIQSTELNASDVENEYVVKLVWQGQHMANMG
mgnify:CR=1 FL=1